MDSLHVPNPCPMKAQGCEAQGGSQPTYHHHHIIAWLCLWVGFDMHASGHRWPRPLSYTMGIHVINGTFHSPQTKNINHFMLGVGFDGAALI